MICRYACTTGCMFEAFVSNFFFAVFQLVLVWFKVCYSSFSHNMKKSGISQQGLLLLIHSPYHLHLCNIGLLFLFSWNITILEKSDVRVCYIEYTLQPYDLHGTESADKPTINQVSIKSNLQACHQILYYIPESSHCCLLFGAFHSAWSCIGHLCPLNYA